MQDHEASESAMEALWSGGVNYPFLFRDEGTWFSRLNIEMTSLHAW